MIEKKRILIIVGTRPEAIKLLPLYMELKENSDEFETLLLSTGQHKEMLEQVFDFFCVKPDIELSLMFKNQSLAGITSLLFQRLQEFVDNSFDLIIVQGDTQSAMVGGMLGFFNRNKVAHIEAGLRTYNKYSPFPEEINRQIIGLVADFHFAPTERAAQNLTQERKENVYLVGNTVIDALLRSKAIVEESNEIYRTILPDLNEYEKVILVTGHRRENFSGGLDNVTAAIADFARLNPQVCFVYPVHLNPTVKEQVSRNLNGIQNVKLIEPLAYDKLVYLMTKSYCIITDSGGIQEEAPTLNVPLLVTRDTTERPEGIEAGCSILVGTSQEVLTKELNRLINDEQHYSIMKNAPNPYGDGSASKRIVDKLKELL